MGPCLRRFYRWKWNVHGLFFHIFCRSSAFFSFPLSSLPRKNDQGPINVTGAYGIVNCEGDGRNEVSWSKKYDGFVLSCFYHFSTGRGGGTHQSASGQESRGGSRGPVEKEGAWVSALQYGGK